jgi:hypothetical protein
MNKLLFLCTTATTTTIAAAAAAAAAYLYLLKHFSLSVCVLYVFTICSVLTVLNRLLSLQALSRLTVDSCPCFCLQLLRERFADVNDLRRPHSTQERSQK